MRTREKRTCKYCGRDAKRNVAPCGTSYYLKTCGSVLCKQKASEYRAARAAESLTGNVSHYDKRRKHFTRKCVVCGKEFSIRHNETGDSKPRSTCSNECLSHFHQKLGALHRGIKESEDSIISRAEKTFNRPQSCESTAMGENNFNAKSFFLIAPDGQSFYGRNLAHFVRTNKHLFTDDELRVGFIKHKKLGASSCEGTKQPVCLTRLSAVLRGCRSSYHGWTGFYTYDEKAVLNQGVQ